MAYGKDANMESIKIDADGTFDLLLVDPPWHYNNNKTGGERNGDAKLGGARKHYSLLQDSILKAMAPEINRIANKDSMLFLWATMPKLDIAIDVMTHWGFSYTTSWMTWIKLKKDTSVVKIRDNGDGDGLIYGPGAYTASNAELLLLGRKGKMLPQRYNMTPSVLFTPRAAHSAKPVQAYDRIELLYPNVSKIELFARRHRDGWTCWGDELKKA